VGPRTGLDNVKKRKIFTLPGLELRPLGHPARSQSLYRLSYPGSVLHHKGAPIGREWTRLRTGVTHADVLGNKDGRFDDEHTVKKLLPVNY
jgi:hypothetical protein